MFANLLYFVSFLFLIYYFFFSGSKKESTKDGGTQTSHDRMTDLKAFDDTKTGVKGLVDAGTTTIPSIFVRPSEERSKDYAICPEHISVPVIDMNESGGRTKETVAKELTDAAKKWGFFQVLNHGIPLEVLQNMIDGVRKFHEQDEETKKELYHRDYQSKTVVYNSNHDLYISKAANWRDTLSINTIYTKGVFDPQDLPPINKDAALEYIDQILKLSDRLLVLLSMGLGLKPERLVELECRRGWSLTCHYYPPCPEPELTLGLNGHADMSFLTILLQDQIGGLQVLHENQWVNVRPVTGALTVNIGDALRIICNDLFKSSFHRAISKSIGPRISIPFFFQGDVLAQRVYGPIQELTSEENPPIYRNFTLGEFMAHFFSVDVDELGVDGFKIRK